MAESQSRYGIMQELNNRKVNEKEKLANIERETDNHIFEEDKKIMTIDEEIKSKTANYVLEFKDRERQRTVNLKMVTLDFDRMKNELESAMKNDSETYESNFQNWKANKLGQKLLAQSELERYKKVQESKIKDKKSILEEIESGISSLKEMSAEQKE